MEIERKFTVHTLPENLGNYSFHQLEQGYLNTNPVVRVRKEDEEYYLTYKGKGFLAREEYNLPLNKESYEHLIQKADGNIISKTRYLIPYEKYTIELDIFHGKFEGLVLAEVEFESIEEAQAFKGPEWFNEDVTENREYANSVLSQKA